MAPRRLALKQRNFINEYLKNGGNATRAALEVYDTNAKVARSIGSENLAKPNVRNEIERVLGNGAIEQALAVTLEALYASTADGKPHWEAGYGPRI
jgi:phage terminase small subunit